MNTVSSRLVKIAAILSLVLAIGFIGCGKSEKKKRNETATKPARRIPTTQSTLIKFPQTLSPCSTKAIDAKHLKIAQEDINKGITFLLKNRNPDGGWGFVPGKSHPALTAMVLKVLLQHPDYDSNSPVVVEGFKCLLKYRQKDGGFYIPKEGNANYITSIAVMALVAAKDPRYKNILEDAIRYLRGRQIVPGSKTPAGEVIKEGHPFIGGVSYGKHGRPDLSNVGMWMEAMHEAGVPGDDPAMQRALAFVTRLQNRSEGAAERGFVFRGTDDGGFIYAVRKVGDKFVGESKAGETRRGLRSYGSMTYVGFKSMLYANVSHDDPRVQAAYKWIRRYWRLDSNPNMPEIRSKEGLFYYYYVFAKALRAWGQDIIPDIRGVKHNWRHELIDVLHSQQRKDGSWVNTASRWMESSPVLVTCYSVLALQEALK